MQHLISRTKLANSADMSKRYCLRLSGQGRHFSDSSLVCQAYDHPRKPQRRREAVHEEEDGAAGRQEGFIHLRIQQRSGRKTLTTIQGISSDYDLKKLVKVCKKEFACNGCVVEHAEYGEVMQLQGDQRNKIANFLTQIGIAREDQIKVHGF